MASKTITVTGVEKDYAGPGTIRIVGTYADVTHTSPAQQVTVGEVPTTKRTFIRLHRVTDAALWCLRYGAASVATYLTSAAKVAYALEPTLTHAPVVSTDPANDTTAFAKATLTASGTISDGDTVTLGVSAGEKVYTFKTTLTPTEGEVLIGASTATALDNLKSAVTHTGTPDTDYKCAAAHTQVTATTNTDTTQLFVSLVVGTTPNTYKSEVTGANLAFGGAVFSGGMAAADFTCVAASEATALYTWQQSTDSGVTFGANLTTTGIYDVGARASGTLTSDNTNNSDGETVTIQNKTYTFKTTLTTTPGVEGEVLIGASADDSLTNLADAVNRDTPSSKNGVKYWAAAAHPLVTSSSVSSHALTITAVGGGTAGNAITTTDYAAHLSWGAATLGSGSASAAGDGGLRVTPTSTTPNGYQYQCTVVNVAGSTESAAATLTVT